ncbi:MAG: alanine/glycine:cation symporter family protein [Bacillota bacterium]|nr:alanine/glycine:cation symporter family protein [Bacillota bacterium]
MIDKIDSVALAIYDFLFNTTYIAPALLILAGIYFTIRLGLPQFRLFGESIKVVSEKPKNKDGISSFGALMVSTASRVGTGNIIGVSTAICVGGFGAIFWMWITAILGGASSFVESTLAQIYKKKDKDGTYYGGPSYYMQDALKQRWLGVIFAIALILTYAVGYNMLAAYNTKTAFSGFSFYDEKVTSIIVGAVLAILFAAVVLGGAKRLTKVTGVLVPIMGVLYIVVSLVVIVLNAKNIPFVFKSIFVSAFDFKAIFGGFAGSCILWGIKRGLYSNEAGMGSAPNAAATADVSHPAKQGLVQMLSVFIDTLLICSATALMCMCANPNGLDEAVKGAPYVQQSMGMALGNFGPIFVAVALCLFAFTTLIGNFYYCEGCLKFILKREPSKIGLLVFRIVACALVFCGCIITTDLAWDAADALQGIMVLINIPVILILSKPAIKALKDYTKQRKEGKNPEFKAADIGLTNTECWK